MEFSSSIRFDSLILSILLFFSTTFLALPAAFPARKLCIRWSVLAHPAICTGASGDLYWCIRRSVLAHPVICTGASGDLYWRIRQIVLEQPKNCTAATGKLYCRSCWCSIMIENIELESLHGAFQFYVDTNLRTRKPKQPHMDNFHHKLQNKQPHMPFLRVDLCIYMSCRHF